MSSHHPSDAEVRLLAGREEERLLADTVTELEPSICCRPAISVEALRRRARCGKRQKTAHGCTVIELEGLLGVDRPGTTSPFSFVQKSLYCNLHDVKATLANSMPGSVWHKQSHTGVDKQLLE